MKKVLLSLLIASSAFGAVRHAPDDLSRHRSKVMEFGARLSSLEKEIGSKNNLYLSSIEQIRQFESDVKLYRGRLKEIRGQVHQSQAENQRILRSYLLESENEATETWQKRVHLELLKQAALKLQAREDELATFEAKVVEFDTKLLSLKKDEEELGRVIQELEGRKKIAMEEYERSLLSKKIAEKKVVAKKIATKVAEVRKQFSNAPVVLQKPERLFHNPVEDFMSYTPSAKGVTFKYKAVQPVKASGSGKVVFAGDLASYGQVVMIDHGSEIRTVLLGRMDIKVKKNDTVSSGEVLAYTANDTREAQNLYFEVRKKNTAQNTILWLESRGVSKI